MTFSHQTDSSLSSNQSKDNNTTTTLPSSGFVLMDKLPGITSHFVVSRIRKALETDRVGHLGTLDPFASGLLPILFGQATRLSEYLLKQDKTYEFTIQLGTETDTLDPTGQVVLSKPVPSSFPSLLEEILPNFRGKIKQVPPAYSAIKFSGRPLYEYMRTEGKLPFDLEEKTREVEIFSLELLGYTETTVTLSASCSSGTYIRSLARDISYALGTCGHCLALRRTRIGIWFAKDAYPIGKETILQKAELSPFLKHPLALLPELPVFQISEDQDPKIKNGQTVYVREEEVKTFPNPLSGASSLGFAISHNNAICFLSQITLNENCYEINPIKKVW